MAARDDSVIRGSLIACIIFLVLSTALNFFLWRWGDTQYAVSEAAKEQLANVNSQIQTMESQSAMMKAMLGKGGLTQAEFDRMAETAGADEEMAQIEEQYLKDMSYFGPEVDPSNRNYPQLPELLVNKLRDMNELYVRALDEAMQTDVDAKADVANARKAQQFAEQKATDSAKQLVSMSDQYDKDRQVINKEKEDTRDRLTKKNKEYNDFRRVATDEQNKATRQSEMLKGTISTQKNQLNELRNDRFETSQGEIRYVFRGGNIVTINLGSADNLRAGITFGVIGGDEARLQDAKVKATIQVTQLQGAHLAQARIVALPETRNPIIPGDVIYSPFWAPGRQVKIALAGDIDIDDDGYPDNELLKGMIHSAGAVVVAEVSASGVVTGKLDPSIRFLVIGEAPNIDDDADEAQVDRDAQSIRAIGMAKARATELGLTVIPAWKLQSYLKIMDDSLTTPLGSAVRGEDFPPQTAPGTNARLPTDLPDLYKRPTEGIQKGNTILPP